jgi:hypothetical protein
VEYTRSDLITIAGPNQGQRMKDFQPIKKKPKASLAATNGSVPKQKPYR